MPMVSPGTATKPVLPLIFESAYVTLASYTSEPPGDTMERGRAAALKAIEMDDAISDAHMALGYVQFGYDWNWSAAE